MYRKSRGHKLLEDINLDSLMDILTCAFGIMLFLVIFAVIEARGVNINMVTPIAKDPPQNSERVVFLCNNGRIRYLGITQSIKRMLGTKQITVENVPTVVNEANQKNISDGYFNYSLNYDEWYMIYGTRRSISIKIEERKNVRGETVDLLKKESSEYAKLIKQFDKSKIWFAFLVDDKSLEVFRKARTIAIKQGFSVGWDPGTVKFPYEEIILGGGNPARSKRAPRLMLSTKQN